MVKKPLSHLYPPNVPREIPPLRESLTDRFESAVNEFSDQPAFISWDEELSYRDLQEKVLHLSAFFQSNGLKKGDRIVLQLPNILQQPISFWASWLSGLTVIPLNPLYRGQELLKPIRESEALAGVFLSSQIPYLKTIVGKTQLRLLVATEPGDLLSFPKGQAINFMFRRQSKRTPLSKSLSLKHIEAHPPLRCVSFLQALKEAASHQVQMQDRGFEETVLIPWTGGTTGKPKGVLLSQKNLLSNIKQCELWMMNNLERGKERALAALPLSHIFALMSNGLVFFLNGFSNILIANPRKISSMIRTLKRQEPTVGIGVNPLFKALLSEPAFRSLDFSKWKIFVSGGLPLEASVQRLWQSVTKSRLVEGYGLTEAGPVVSCNRLDRPFEGFVGLPLPSTEVRVVDEQGVVLRAEEEGELEVRGPQVMKQYFISSKTHPEEESNLSRLKEKPLMNQEKNQTEDQTGNQTKDQTKDQTGNQTKDQTGNQQAERVSQEEEEGLGVPPSQVFSPGAWLKTGDIAFISKEALIKIMGRKKDMINISGFKVYPREVEEVLLSLDGVSKALVYRAVKEAEEKRGGVAGKTRGKQSPSSKHPSKLRRGVAKKTRDKQGDKQEVLDWMTDASNRGEEEEVRAFIVRTPSTKTGSVLTAEKLRSLCREKLAPYKIPKQIEFVSELPKSKIQPQSKKFNS